MVSSVLANDSDVDGDALTVSRFDAASARGGTVSCGASGDCAYAPPANFAGTDSWGYDVSDGAGASDPATVVVTVAPVNDDPVAADDAASTPQYQAVVVGALANDSDVDGDGLTLVAVAEPGHGTATAGADGTITYTPDSSFKGSDSFEYTIADGNGGAATATVEILEDGCGEDGPVSGAIDRDVESLAGAVSPDLAHRTHEANCNVIAPTERALPI